MCFGPSLIYIGSFHGPRHPEVELEMVPFTPVNKVCRYRFSHVNQIGTQANIQEFDPALLLR